MKRWIMAGCMVLLVFATAHADPLRSLGGHWKWWEDPNIRSNLELTDDQVTKIRELVRTRREPLIDLKAGVEKKALLLSDEVERSDYDVNRALAAADELLKARNELERARMALLLEIRALLGQEQFFKLRQMGERRKRDFRGKRRPGGWGHSPGLEPSEFDPDKS